MKVVIGCGLKLNTIKTEHLGGVTHTGVPANCPFSVDFISGFGTIQKGLADFLTLNEEVKSASLKILNLYSF